MIIKSFYSIRKYEVRIPMTKCYWKFSQWPTLRMTIREKQCDGTFHQFFPSYVFQYDQRIWTTSCSCLHLGVTLFLWVIVEPAQLDATFRFFIKFIAFSSIFCSLTAPIFSSFIKERLLACTLDLISSKSSRFLPALVVVWGWQWALAKACAANLSPTSWI